MHSLFIHTLDLSANRPRSLNVHSC